MCTLAMRVERLLKKTGEILLAFSAFVFLACLTIEFAIFRQIKIPVVKKESKIAEDIGRPDIIGSQFLTDFENSVSQSPSRLRGKMKAVVVVAGFRTGSSFVGEFFNRHKDVFYLFEPLFFSNWKRSGGSSINKVIEDLLQCNTTSMFQENYRALIDARQIFRNLRSDQTLRNLQDLQRCLYHGLCFRHKSAALCTREMCMNETTTDCRHCPAPPIHLMERACMNSRVHAFKVIRLGDLEDLYRSWTNENIDLRIIHLVRDPRSTILSRMHLTNPAPNAKDILGLTCERNYRMHSQYLGNDTRYQWLKGIYKVVRYEDIIENPPLLVSRLYEFLNFSDFQPDQNVQQWLSKSIIATDPNPFSTSRDVEVQKYKWRQLIPLQLAEDVQRECKHMMSLLGYKVVTSEKQLLNMTDPLLEDVM